MPRIGVPLYVAVVGVLSLFFAGESGAGGGDKRALLEVKSAVTEDPLGFFSDWDSTDLDPCSWTGVSCDSGRVTTLRLSSNGCSKAPLPQSGNFSLYPFWVYGGISNGSSNNLLRGKLSPAIAELDALRVLSIAFNGLTGELPREIGNLHLLEVLDLGFNSFTGAIPLSLQNCTSLQSINLSGNRFNGTVPSFLARFPSVKLIALSYNLFTGPIPHQLGTNCQFLEHLDLSGNSLSGPIPSSLGNCRKLQSLMLSSNLLQGKIPPSLGNLGLLQVLDLSRNFLGDSIPPELSNCRQLKLLVLKNIYGPLISRTIDQEEEEEEDEDDYNYFIGEFPATILGITTLRVIWAPQSNLVGTFPQNWSSVSSLEMLNFAHNFFTGEFPASIANCKGLYFLDLSSNNLTGSLPGNTPVPCMAVFNISMNFLSGNIPNFGKCSDKFGNLMTPVSDLVTFYSNFFYRKSVTSISSFSSRVDDGVAVLHDFSNNVFTGAAPPLLIPPESLSARPFYVFRINGNNFEGNLSEYSFDKCLSFEGMVFDISNNKISGEIPSDIATICRTLKLLNMAGNDFTGSFPRAFIYLDSLLHLNLSRNQLEGQIPSFIGQMKDLRALSLSGNYFRGSVPQELSQLASLEVLELSFNTLSGEIPPDLTNLEHLNILRLDHNNLSGQIPVVFRNMTWLSVFNVSFNNLSGSVPMNLILSKCDNVQGNPYLDACSNSSFSDWEQKRNITQQEQPDSPSENIKNGFNPIELASIISASIIVFILIALILLFVCMKSFGSKSVYGQGTERKEVVTCNDIGVELTYENVVRATGGFNVQNCIGSGGFGATYKAEIRPGAVVAVKRLSVGRFQGVQQFSAEIRTLGRVQHPNLVTLIGYHVSESEMFLIYNYLPGGNLEKFITDRPKRTAVWPWAMLHKIALDIARALTYLHDECVPRVLHRDIKPSNILLDNEFNAYLSDFGLARLLGTSETHATTDVAGTFGYVAPEYAMTCRVSDKADVYSYGVVVLELISDKKALDPSFSSYGNGFNIVAWASMLLREGRAEEFFTAGLWDGGPHNDLIEILHLAIMCTGESLSARPSMRQVAQRLKRIQPTVS